MNTTLPPLPVRCDYCGTDQYAYAALGERCRQSQEIARRYLPGSPEWARASACTVAAMAVLHRRIKCRAHHDVPGERDL